MSAQAERELRRDIRRAFGQAALDTIENQADAITALGQRLTTYADSCEQRLAQIAQRQKVDESRYPRCEACGNRQHYVIEVDEMVCDVCTHAKANALRFEQQAELITAWACFQQRTWWERLRWIVTGR